MQRDHAAERWHLPERPSSSLQSVIATLEGTIARAPSGGTAALQFDYWKHLKFPLCCYGTPPWVDRLTVRSGSRQPLRPLYLGGGPAN